MTDFTGPSSGSSSSSSTDDLVAKLAHVRQTARTLASGYLSIADDADRAIDSVKWGVESGSLNSLPSAYALQLQRTAERLDQGFQDISSARSDIQFLISGSTSAAVEATLSRIPAAPFYAPLFNRDSVHRDLDQLLAAVTGSEELSTRRREAWITLSRGTEEAAAQACHTLRELLTVLLDKYSSNAAVKAAPWWVADPETRDGVSKRHKIRYFVACGAIESLPETVLAELDRQVSRALDAHQRTIALAHGKQATSFELAKAAMIELEEVMLTLLRYRASLKRC